MANKSRTDPLCILFLLSAVSLLLMAQAKDAAAQQPKKILSDTVFVYDGLFSGKSLPIMSHFAERHAPWDFIYPEKYEGMKSNDNGNLHWVANLSPTDFAGSKIWKLVGNKVPAIFAGKKYFPYEAQAILINRGDFPTVQKAKKNGDLLMRIFLTEGLKKNSYSELVFYDEKDEIFGCVFPKYGRTVIWNDTVDFIFKPPSMNQINEEYSLFIKATTDRNRFEESVKKFKEQALSRNLISKEPFPLSKTTEDVLPKIDLSQHLAREFYDSQNRTVSVFDDVVPKSVLFALRKYFFQYDSSYVYNVYDPAYTEDHDNVNWVAQVPAELLPKSLVWRYIQLVASYVSNETNWYPYDVSMNIIQHSHHPRIHADCKPWEHEYTFLMYLTPEWKEDRYGETIFFEETNQGSSEGNKFKYGNEKYETLGAVSPKFGRIVIFRNIIEHSARPPSSDFLAARYTFAVKIGRSPEIAVAKKLREMLGDFVEEGKDGYQLLEDLTAGKYDTAGNVKNEEFLNEKYMHYKKIKQDIERNTKERVFGQLSMKFHK